MLAEELFDAGDAQARRRALLAPVCFKKRFLVSRAVFEIRNVVHGLLPRLFLLSVLRKRRELLREQVREVGLHVGRAGDGQRAVEGQGGEGTCCRRGRIFVGCPAQTDCLGGVRDSHQVILAS